MTSQVDTTPIVKATGRALKKGLSYTDPELEIICLAGLRVSEDSLKGTSNKKKDLEKSMLIAFEQIAVKRGQVFPQRDGSNLWRKFRQISTEVTKFSNAVTQAEATLPSGHNDVLSRASELFKKVHDRPFKFMQCYLILRHHEKWRELPGGGRPSDAPGGDGGGGAGPAGEIVAPSKVRKGRDTAKKLKSETTTKDETESNPMIRDAVMQGQRLANLANTISSLGSCVKFYPELELKHRGYINQMIMLQDQELASSSNSYVQPSQSMPSQSIYGAVAEPKIDFTQPDYSKMTGAELGQLAQQIDYADDYHAIHEQNSAQFKYIFETPEQTALQNLEVINKVLSSTRKKKRTETAKEEDAKPAAIDVKPKAKKKKARSSSKEPRQDVIREALKAKQAEMDVLQKQILEYESRK